MAFPLLSKFYIPAEALALDIQTERSLVPWSEILGYLVAGSRFDAVHLVRNSSCNSEDFWVSESVEQSGMIVCGVKRGRRTVSERPEHGKNRTIGVFL